jgi:hypothetical protein
VIERAKGIEPSDAAWEAASEATIVDHFMLEDPQIEQLHYAERTGFPG